MATIEFRKELAKALELDGSLQKQAWAFLQKMLLDHTAPGLHVEPIVGSADPRVRTGRVNDNYRAVMFLLEGGAEPRFVVAAIKKHNEANRLAERIIFRLNPVHGVPEVFDSLPTEVSSKHISKLRPDIAWNSPLLAFTRDELINRLGIDPVYVDAALAASSEDDVLNGLDGAPGWQCDAILSLTTGSSIESVLENLGLETTAADPFDLPAAKMDFTTVTTDTDLLAVLSGSFVSWRTFLHPEQRRYANHESYNGAFRLSGGAGTGKTVVALHRARKLAIANPAARIVMTTYTTTLAESLLQSLESLDPDLPLAVRLGSPGILIMGVDKLAAAALRSLPSGSVSLCAPHLTGEKIAPLLGDQDLDVWANAALAADLRPELSTVDFLQSEYRTIVLAQGIHAVEQYLAAPRPGRGVRLSRSERLALWSVFAAYRSSLSSRNEASFAEIAAIAGSALDLDADNRPADHVIIDEAQDFHAGHWKLVRALVAEGPNDLFICEDSHQRIYGEKVVLSHFGIGIRGRSRRLTLNYRTTRQNLGYALGLLQGTKVTDLEGESEDTSSYRSALSGPIPQIFAVESAAEELNIVASALNQWLSQDGVEPETLAVLVRDKGSRDRIQRGLLTRGIKAQVIDGPSRVEVGQPQLLTMHRAKGLEFRKVIIAGKPEGDLLSDPNFALSERDRSLYYVAATRARDELVLIERKRSD